MSGCVVCGSRNDPCPCDERAELDDRIDELPVEVDELRKRVETLEADVAELLRCYRGDAIGGRRG